MWCAGMLSTSCTLSSASPQLPDVAPDLARRCLPARAVSATSAAGPDAEAPRPMGLRVMRGASAKAAADAGLEGGADVAAPISDGVASLHAGEERVALLPRRRRARQQQEPSLASSFPVSAQRSSDGPGRNRKQGARPTTKPPRSAQKLWYGLLACVGNVTSMLSP